MALGIRGANPIWAEFDLQGNLFDDTFYLFVLENTIPYVPAKVYHDPDLQVVWTQPIQFLGNGTLPIDIYFEADKVYRLEFRQGDTQQDPLIYEVNDYVSGTGGSTPVDTVALSSSNQVTNPQFALYNLANPDSPTSAYNFSGTDPDPINIAPGWDLLLAGTGTVAISQFPLNDSNINPSNAPYALHLVMNGWTNGSAILRQRFEQNGMLWANEIVSTTITAKLNGSPQSISADLIDSNDSLLGHVLETTPINEEWNEYTGYSQLTSTTNPDTPPVAYIDYLLRLPSNIDIYLTSIQLVVQNLPVKPSFQQDSINRQIDHTYNRAYPIVPVGTVIDYGGFITTPDTVPAHYLLCNYSAVSRAKYNLLFHAITATETVALILNSNTFTVADSTYYRLGMGLENAGIPANTIIIGISGNTITMSHNATITGSTSVRFFASNQTYTETVALTNASNTFVVDSATNYQIGMLLTGNGIIVGTLITNIVGTTVTMSNAASFSPPPNPPGPTLQSLVSFYAVNGNGDGSTTFRVYGLQGRVIAGSGGEVLGGFGYSGLGSSGGAAFHTQTIDEMVSHKHPGTTISASTEDSNINLKQGGSTITGSIANVVNIAAQGGGIPFPIVQPTTIMHKLIRFE